MRTFLLAPLLVFAIGMMAGQEKPPSPTRVHLTQAQEREAARLRHITVGELWMGAQEKPPPALTEIQKLQIANLTQRLEIAQLKMQAAQADFEAARVEIGALIKTLQQPGYDLNLQTLSYTKKPEEKK